MQEPKVRYRPPCSWISLLIYCAANSDRRPVDPPPVVELRIKEGPSWDEGKEITFDYNASFFLYASLEQHRKIAPGRMQGQPNPPILTGVPASGMAYLDRPAAAGYFIFPDLSVRHEGQYRLSFSLFETTKEEKDFDLEPADISLPNGVDWRMEIKTAPFDVYSAKKFPGLMESTSLSKEVADQGCRVRIRRDVRMRKREGKGNGHDRREEDFSRRRTVTPATEDANIARARSVSKSSDHRTPYAPEPQRRPSESNAYPPPPLPPRQSYEPASRGHLAFGDQSHHYAAPRQYSHQPLAPMSSPGPYPPSQYSNKPETHQPYPYPPSRNVSNPCPSPALRNDGHDRRISNGYVPPSPSIYSSHDGHSRRDSYQSYPPTPIAALPPARIQLQPKDQVQASLAPLKINNLVSPIEAQTEQLPEPAPLSIGGKRKHDDVFSHSNRPLFNGQRQIDPHHGGRHRGLSPDSREGTYIRADGSVQYISFGTWRTS